MAVIKGSVAIRRSGGASDVIRRSSAWSPGRRMRAWTLSGTMHPPTLRSQRVAKLAANRLDEPLPLSRRSRSPSGGRCTRRLHPSNWATSGRNRRLVIPSA